MPKRSTHTGGSWTSPWRAFLSCHGGHAETPQAPPTAVGTAPLCGWAGCGVWGQHMALLWHTPHHSFPHPNTTSPSQGLWLSPALQHGQRLTGVLSVLQVHYYLQVTCMYVEGVQGVQGTLQGVQGTLQGVQGVQGTLKGVQGTLPACIARSRQH